MAQYQMNLSFQELITLLKKKKCPNCGNKSLKRRFHKEFIKTAPGKGRNNLGLENYYDSTPVYYCEDCKRKYTLKGLTTGVELTEDDKLMVEGESKESIKQRDVEVNEVNRVGLRKIFGLVSIVMILILLSVVILDNNWIVLLVFGPLILLFALILMYLTK